MTRAQRRIAMLMVLDAAATGDCLIRDGRLRAWYGQVHEMGDTLRTPRPDDGRRALGLTRALLIADGTLGPTASSPAGMALARFDHVRTVEAGHLDTGGLLLPPPEVPGRIVRVAPDQPSVTVNFATWGAHRLIGDDLLVIEHDYVTRPR